MHLNLLFYFIGWSCILALGKSVKENGLLLNNIRNPVVLVSIMILKLEVIDCGDE